ncbi:hypothetical protein [Glutamicibacter sp. BW77]|uniref:hypothetical protein n=1 Tax=Glutamicibacter sp. BW77 TaxID=2024402 RepID=UPI001482A68E|nr:hypothetical protein [Glutamicibacter sp. BW77]
MQPGSIQGGPVLIAVSASGNPQIRRIPAAPELASAGTAMHSLGMRISTVQCRLGWTP